MNLLNRIVIILLILAAMVVIPLILMFPGEAQTWLRYVADVIQANVKWLEDLQPAEQIGMRLILAAVSMVVFVLGLLLIALEVIRIRRSTVRLKDGSGELMMSGVTEHLSYYVDLLPDVLRVRPVVQSAGKSIRVTLNVETAPGVSVLEKSDEVRQTAHQVIEEQLGLNVKGEIKVVIKPVPDPKSHRGRGTFVGMGGKPSVPQPKSEELVSTAALEDLTGEAPADGGKTIEVKVPSGESEASSGDSEGDVADLPDGS